MTDLSPIKELDAMRAAYEALDGLSPEAAARVLNWLAQQMGLETFFAGAAEDDDEINEIDSLGDDDDEAGAIRLSRRGRAWLARLGIYPGDLEELVHVDGDTVEYLLHELPGGSLREKTTNAYLFVGAVALLLGEKETFADEEARELCRIAEVYDRANHASYLRSVKQLITGSKTAGFKLTGPGKKRAGELLLHLVRKGGSDA